AVSYCWGDKNDTTEVRCGDGTITIQFNLKAFLLPTRRKRNTTSMLWIDSICINQADPEERSAQVRKMRDIYQRATRTLIWLGPEGDESTGGLDFAERLCNAYLWDMKATKTPRMWPLRRLEFSTLWNKGWKPFFAPFDRPWFARSWIVQEAVVSEDA
ncbi:heterokaryon incompatibility, partial [Mytilinidion resinicola]